MDRARMINVVTGTEMSVPADLVEKFLAAGHKLVEDPVLQETPVKKPARKKTAEK